MLRLAQNLWTSLFPTDLVYPVQIVGDSQSQIEDDAQLVEAMKSMFRLFTYRDHFEGIPSDYRTLHSDQGWGCLLRTTQMLLAHFLLRCARADDHQLSFFFDKSGDDAPFSVHNLVQSVWSGRSFRPEYWSPSQGCRAICNTVEQAVHSGVLRTRAAVVCASNGCVVYDEDVVQALANGAESVLLLTPMRVSASAQLTQETYLQLVRLLEQPQCIGMVGGVPGRSYYFFGFSQTQLVYLDPHMCIQPAFTSDSPAATKVCVPGREQVRCVHWSRVETSCFLAFAVSSREEWGVLRRQLQTKFLHVEDQKEKSLSLSCSLHSLPEELSTHTLASTSTEADVVAEQRTPGRSSVTEMANTGAPEVSGRLPVEQERGAIECDGIATPGHAAAVGAATPSATPTTAKTHTIGVRPVSDSIPIPVGRGGADRLGPCEHGSNEAIPSRHRTRDEVQTSDDKDHVDVMGEDERNEAVSQPNTTSVCYHCNESTRHDNHNRGSRSKKYDDNAYSARMPTHRVEEPENSARMTAGTGMCRNVCGSSNCDARMDDALVNESWDKMSDMNILRSLSSTRRSSRSYPRREVLYVEHTCI